MVSEYPTTVSVQIILHDMYAISEANMVSSLTNHLTPPFTHSSP